MKALALAAILAVGCGGGTAMVDGPPMPDALILGNWIATVNASCGTAFDVSESTFVFGVICVNADQSIDLQAQTGTWSLNGSSLMLTNEKASCPGTAAQDLETATVTASSLTLSDSAGLISFVRNTYPASSASATYGCFSGGTFTPSPLAPL